MIEKKINIIKEEPFVGEDGLDYIKVTKEILTPRKTFLKGMVSGKYRGDKIPDDYDKSDLYDFEIYEAEVTCNSIDDFSKNKPFVFPNDFKNIDNQKKIKGSVFPKSKLPETLPVIISANDKTFGINVLEPKLFEFSIIRKLHQTEGEQVFGSFNAYITGYVFDFEREEVEEIVGPVLEGTVQSDDPPIPPEPIPCIPSNVETGKTETKGSYIRKEFKCRNHNDNVWGKWEYYGNKAGYNTFYSNSGCLGDFISLIGVLIFLGFLIAVLPGLGYFILFYLAILLIGLLAPYLKWIFRAIGIVLLIAFIGSLINAFNDNSVRYNPPPTTVDTQEETTQTIEPIVENKIDNSNTQKNNEKDYLIKKYREWRDYDSNNYKGYYTLKQSDVRKAGLYKTNLQISSSNISSYDEIVYSLKENDKTKLDGLYKLFDSIQSNRKLSNIKFAEMVVSFVQDIPYVLILEDNCDANLYSDNFTRRYLSNPKAKCSGFQRFGINTPVEFLYNLNGDCDTRTLLLYTVLSHYNYDVALMSSEFYGHSILGVNLPLNGLSYSYNNQKYILWETTTQNVKPGLIPNEISNLNNWRISLKSK
ncbi:hypothetical protein [Flavobacterium sp. UBA7682]|uniref:hypothetical protein n=1 Tax=Flavobacterium sp. UBA7682 TaxID=1946560 RepID=UPI0025C6BCDF|nr:hypothetical protein [Flavobacterium sp. UBA7682]